MASPGAREGEPPFALPPLVATSTLAAVAGYVDAFGYLHLFGTFTANMSGNAVLLGIAIGEESWDLASRHLTALASFVLGVIVSRVIEGRAAAAEQRTPGGAAGPHRPTTVLLVELVTLVGLTLAVTLLGGGDRPFHDLPGLVLIAPAAFAMGVQTLVITRTHGVATSTTYESGAVAHLGEELASGQLEVDPAVRATARRRSRVLATVLGAYIGGAALGTLVGRWWTAALVVPTVVVALLLLLRHDEPHDASAGPAPAA